MKLNPAVCREAEWRDGVLTLDTYAEVASLMGLPLYKEEEPIKPHCGGYDLEGLDAMLMAEEYAQAADQRIADETARRMQDRAGRIASLQTQRAAKQKEAA